MAPFLKNLKARNPVGLVTKYAQKERRIDLQIILVFIRTCNSTL